jgi:hypothetical protein
MSISPEDVEMKDLKEMLHIPDSPRADSPTSEISRSLSSAAAHSSLRSPTPSTSDSSSIFVSRIFTYADYEGLGTTSSPSIESTDILDIPESQPFTPLFDIPESPPSTPNFYPHSLFDIPDSRPPSPLYDPHALFDIPESQPPTPISHCPALDIPASQPSTPMLVDYETSPVITAAGQANNTSPFQPAAPPPSHPKTPPINGRNLIPFLPIITGRAALIRGALSERKSERLHLRSKIDSVLQDMAELERQLDTMDAFRVIRAAEEQQRSS